jgi:outer membrane lipoprotein-sorting protein
VLVLAVGTGVANLPFAGTTIARAAANFLSSVAHNSSLTGDGTTALPLGIANNGVGTNQLADNSVTSSKIASGQVGTNQLADNSITSSKIASGQAVKSFNGLFDNVSLVAGSNVTLTPSGNTLTISSLLGLTSVSRDSSLTGDGTGTSPLGIASGQVTRSVNGLTDNVSLVAGDNVTITPSGNTLTIASSQPPQPYINPLRVATLQWYSVNETGVRYTIPPGNAGLLAFDGANMWVVSGHQLFSEVTKLRASDGANLGTFTAGTENPLDIVFDGAHMWVSNGEDNTLQKIRTSDGAMVGGFPVALSPQNLAFDGANMWVTHGSSFVTKFRPSDGVNLGTFSVGSSPSGIAFDGANIWVVNSFSNSVTKLRASDGAPLGTFNVGERPRKIVFDGANIWVLNFFSKTVTKLRAGDGVNVGTFSLADFPGDIAFDGALIWLTTNFSVTKLRASDGANLGTFSVPQGAGSLAFDGANMWVTSGNTVTKL